MKQIILVIVLLGLLLQSCQKQQLPHYTINPGLMSAWGFKTGTYWIYQDSLSGEVDSFAVTGTQFKTGIGTTESVDEYHINISTYKIDSFKINWEITLIDSTLSLILWNHSDMLEEYLQYDVFNYPLFYNQFMITVDTEVVSCVYNTLSLNNIVYNNVDQIHHFYSIDQGNVIYGGFMKHDDWFYACDNVGFVKMVFNHPEDSLYRNWELLRYHIEK